MRRKEQGERRRGGNAALLYGSYKSPIGVVYAALDGDKVIALSFTSRNESDFAENLSLREGRPVRRSDKAAEALIRELREYFEGERRRFGFPFVLSGCTEFQKKALKAAATIPYGQTRTYGWLARRAGNPRAARAAGQVMARNPVPIIIPCHRVIGSCGELRGFGGGLGALELKKALLEREGALGSEEQSPG